MSKITICLDPGHGGTDRSNRGASGKYVEADGNLQFALFLRDELKNDFNVVMTRTTDTTLGLTARAKVAVNAKASMFISIHSDAFDNKTSGVKVFDSINLKNEEIAKKIGQATATAMGIKFLGHRERESEKYKGNDYYTVIDVAHDGGVPVVLLLERGFHSNPNEEKLLLDANIVKKSAQAVAREIKTYYGIVSKTVEVKPVVQDDTVASALTLSLNFPASYKKKGVNYVPVRDFFESLGHSVGYDNVNKKVLVNGKVFPFDVVIESGKSFAAIRDLANFVNLKISYTEYTDSVVLKK